MKMTSSSHHQHLQSVKTRLMEQVVDLAREKDSIWEKITAEQELYERVFDEQQLVNEEFSRYHEIWNILTLRWPDEYHPIFIAIDNGAVANFGNWFSGFENRSKMCIDSIINVKETIKSKANELDRLRERIFNTPDMNFLNSINLDHFQWVDHSSWPKIEQLNTEWGNKKLLETLSHYVTEISQLLNCPLDLLEDLLVQSQSSSDSAESISSGGHWG